MNKKFELLLDDTVEYFGIKLFRIRALNSFGNVEAGDIGGYIEKKENLSEKGNAWVYGDAMVSGDAKVYGNACVSGDARVYGNAEVSGDTKVCLKASYTKGRFVGGDDSGKITDITDKTGTTYLKNQYVLGDYEITPIEDEKPETIEIGGIKYNKQEVEDKLKGIKPIQ